MKIKKVLISGAIILALVAISLIIVHGNYLQAESLYEARQYLEGQGFNIEEMEDGYYSWSQTVHLRAVQFVEKAQQHRITVVYVAYSEYGYDFNFWFYIDNIRYELFEKYYIPTEAENEN